MSENAATDQEYPLDRFPWLNTTVKQSTLDELGMSLEEFQDQMEEEMERTGEIDQDGCPAHGHAPAWVGASFIAAAGLFFTIVMILGNGLQWYDLLPALGTAAFAAPSYIHDFC